MQENLELAQFTPLLGISILSVPTSASFRAASPARSDMVPYIYGLIDVQFNPIYIQFIELLYCISFVLLDLYIESAIKS